MDKVKKTISIEARTVELIKKIAKSKRMTKSAVIDLAIERLATEKLATIN